MEIRAALDAMHTERAALEVRLRTMIDAELKAFTDKTGVYINAARVDFIDVTMMMSKQRQYVVGELKLSIATE